MIFIKQFKKMSAKSSKLYSRKLEKQLKESFKKDKSKSRRSLIYCKSTFYLAESVFRSINSIKFALIIAQKRAET